MAFKSPKVVKGKWGEVSTKSMRIRWAGPWLHPEKMVSKKGLSKYFVLNNLFICFGRCCCWSLGSTLARSLFTNKYNHNSQFNTRYIRDSVSLARKKTIIIWLLHSHLKVSWNQLGIEGRLDFQLLKVVKYKSLQKLCLRFMIISVGKKLHLMTRPATATSTHFL